VASLYRYPVKSMLGEQLERAVLSDHGLDHDRALALIDVATGLVATAKHPRLWRALLQYSAQVDRDRVLVSSPQGWTREADDPELAMLLTTALGRSVRVAAERPTGSSVERPDPEDVLERGVEATVPAALLEIGQGSPGANFVDYAPIHLITTATLEQLAVDPRRYRPNIIVESSPGTVPYSENDWVGREIELGGVVLEVVMPTPRCAVPTLEHGPLGRAPEAVRALMAANRVDVPGFGVLPCAGAYARVRQSGKIETGSSVHVS
jgi:hypothetical protein